MRQRTTRTFLAMMIAITLVFVSDGISILYANISSVIQLKEYPISFKNATSIALSHEPDARALGQPVLVSYAGMMVYEVTLDTGRIYVDAETGRVIANTARGPISCEVPPGS